jgi:hypothetical protein
MLDVVEEGVEAGPPEDPDADRLAGRGCGAQADFSFEPRTPEVDPLLPALSPSADPPPPFDDPPSPVDEPADPADPAVEPAFSEAAESPFSPSPEVPLDFALESVA